MSESESKSKSPPSDARGFADWTARNHASEAISRIEAHEKECNQHRRNTEQWQNSADRVMARIEKNLGSEIKSLREMLQTHSASDLNYQQQLNMKLDGWNKWFMTTLTSVILVLASASVGLLIKLLSVQH